MAHILAPLLSGVNSATRCVATSVSHNPGMEKSKKSKIEPIHVEEAGRLNALFKDRAGMSQEAFGDAYDIGTQGMVWQYLNAKSPLNVEAAINFARGLRCKISEFSPRLANIVMSAPDVSDSQNLGLSTEAIHIAKIFQDLPQEVRLDIQRDITRAELAEKWKAQQSESPKSNHHG